LLRETLIVSTSGLYFQLFWVAFVEHHWIREILFADFWMT